MKRLAWVVGLLAAAAGGCGSVDDDRPPTLAYVTEAVLQPACAQAECHSTFSDTYGFAFDTVEAARASFVNSGFANVPDGNPDDSPLAKIVTVGYPIEDINDPIRMPYDLPIPDYDTYLIKAWIASGLQNAQGEPEGVQCLPSSTDPTRGCDVLNNRLVECDADGNAGALITDCGHDMQTCSEGACVP